MNGETLLPVEGCWVQRRGDATTKTGTVRERRDAPGGPQIKVKWANGGADDWIPLSSLQCGLQTGWTVQDIPVSTTRKPLGPGRIVGRRELGGREQILVQLDENGRSVWLPYENLRRIKDVQMRYARAETGSADHAERFRLRLLAHALENWNQLTGALDRLDVDPLPHQIQLVHRILSSGNYNWLIADDVGLGKTIEVGLLLAALKRKGQARRVLIVAPAGLTRQWQDELQYKFGAAYEIYGRDFIINKPEHWKLHDHAIVSLDLAKREEHLTSLATAGGWDIVVFDESHRLTRYGNGERSDRYRLAEALRPTANAFLLLSGTPHQGYADRFQALLELVRPDLTAQIQALEINPEIVRDIILRNRKSEVTDAEGNFIFKGQKIHRVPVMPSEVTQQFHRLLHDYLVRGYKAGESQGSAGRAIGFVMTTYRKLASSSIAAIEAALRRRLERLSDQERLRPATSEEPEIDAEALVEGGDEQDDLPRLIGGGPAQEFFASESEMIASLLTLATRVRAADEKLRLFLEQIVAPLMVEGKKLLVFTEYCATQSYLQEALSRRFPDAGATVLIHGSMKLEEKLESIADFNETARFLISTEAGGEGINLHQACHVMVNYDLPWNPARLVQRIGRLYRYGQKEIVIVFNLHAKDSFDNSAIDLMLGRVMEIARGMAPVGAEFNERLYAEILGELLENIDFASVLQSATSMQIEPTRQQIDEALARAQRARGLQQEIFSHVSGFDPDALKGTLGFTMQHLEVFIKGMMPIIDATIEQQQYGGAVLEVRLPEDCRGQFAEFGQRTLVRVTTDRRLTQRLKDVVLLDFETPFLQHLIATAKAHRFDGLYAVAASSAGADGLLAAVKLRWQNDQGEPLTEEFLALFKPKDGPITANPPFLVEWLISPLTSIMPPNTEPKSRKEAFDAILQEAGRRLGDESTRFKHPNGLVPLAAADCRPVG
jgi:superfamily II DNA or RNA helicase